MLGRMEIIREMKIMFIIQAIIRLLSVSFVNSRERQGASLWDFCWRLWVNTCRTRIANDLIHFAGSHNLPHIHRHVLKVQSPTSNLIWGESRKFKGKESWVFLMAWPLLDWPALEVYDSTNWTWWFTFFFKEWHKVRGS